ncbi:Ff.00g052590.m01.CDS01 [Fusarium sp. VM40]|nr:Ff.00g052590.m01.CDS01 [Fusarium sp. VM40]
MAPEPPPPLPVAANHATLSNKLSLLIASRSSVLKNMSLSRPTTTKRRVIPDDNDDDLTRGTARPNDGVGYVPEEKDKQKFANAKVERMLRGRMAKGGTGKVKKKVDESESEEDAGRSALGKRKRPRKEKEINQEPVAEPEPESRVQHVPTEPAEDEEKNEAGGEAVEDIIMEDGVTKGEDTDKGKEAIDKKRKRKNKKKKKQQTNIGEAAA